MPRMRQYLSIYKLNIINYVDASINSINRVSINRVRGKLQTSDSIFQGFFIVER